MKRHWYTISKGGETSQLGYLFEDNVIWWQRQGYAVTLKGMSA